MSRADKLQALAELEAAEQALGAKLEQIRQSDPFWWYQPSDGTLSDEAKKFLAEHIQPEDIPQKFDSQLDVHLCDAPTVMAGGGNRVGKSTLAPIEVFIHITGELPISLRGIYPNSKLEGLPKVRRVRVVGESAAQMKEVVIPKYQYWVPRSYLKQGSWENSYNAEFKILSLYSAGRLIGTVQFMTNEQAVKNFQGAELTLVVYDEEPLFEIYKENLLRFGTTKLRQLFAMTPTNGMSWAHSEIVAKQGETVRCFKLCSVTNRFINYESMAEIIARIPSYQERKMRILGEWVSLSGLVYGGLFNRDLHVIDAFPVGRKVKDIRGGGERILNAAYVVLRGIDPHMVKPTACVELAVDRAGICYVAGCYLPHSAADMEQVKADLAERAEKRFYRLAWTQCDKSADSDIAAFKDLNIFQILRTGKNAIRGIDKSAKFTGSIAAGVDTIKQYLKVDPVLKKPRLLIMNTEENQPLIQAFETLERDTYANEDKKGQKDKIAEGKHDLHAALRYIFQRRVTYIPPEQTSGQGNETEDEQYI